MTVISHNKHNNHTLRRQSAKIEHQLKTKVQDMYIYTSSGIWWKYSLPTMTWLSASYTCMKSKLLLDLCSEKKNKKTTKKNSKTYGRTHTQSSSVFHKFNHQTPAVLQFSGCFIGLGGIETLSIRGSRHAGQETSLSQRRSSWRRQEEALDVGNSTVVKRRHQLIIIGE